MRQFLAQLAMGALVGGCSWIYDPNSIPRTDASTIDAEIDAPALRDADPSMLMIDDVSPKQIYEGQGDGGSRPVILVIHGHNIVDGFTLDIQPSAGLTFGTAMRANNGDYIAVPVTFPVDKLLGKTSTPLTITVNEPGAASPAVLAGKLTKEGLPELDGATTLSAALPLEPRYSESVVGTTLSFTGTPGRVAITSMSQISIGTITGLKGGDASGATGGAAGLGGCAGGGGGTAGSCGTGGGGAGASGTGTTGGGGGGGFGGPGLAGGGASGGAVGASHGDPTIASYDGVIGDGTDTNRSSGGGGGAANGIGAAGGGGGGGGGTIELAAGGTIMLGTLDASGGAGSDGASGVAGNGGGGGGGAGGVIVLRTDTGTIATTNVIANGGTVGAGKGNGTSGGGGGVGRIRWEGVQAAAPTTNPPPHRNPAFTLDTPPVVTELHPMLTMLGTDGDVVDFYVIDKDGGPHTGEPVNVGFPNGTATFAPTMLPGYNLLCATVRPAVHGTHEADKCIEIGYLP